MNREELSRRQLLKYSASLVGVAALGPALSGCASSTASHANVAATTGRVLRDVLAGAEQVQLAPAQSVNATGTDLFTFGLLLKSGAFIEDGRPQVWLAHGQSTAAIGPFPATWHALTAYGGSGDHSPVTTLPGFYAATIQAPTPGSWFVAAVADSGSARAAGVGTITVSGSPPAAVGSRALATPTPVASTPAALAAICSREPPDPMHYISLDRALRTPQPTVACFATPLFCESRMCAPVLDEVLAVYHRLAHRAAFIHIEEYPQRDTTHPARAFSAWGFETEPWTVLIDRQGVIRSHFEGPVTAEQLTDALMPLL